MSTPETVIVYACRPLPGTGGLGGTEFAFEGTLAEEGVRAQWTIDTDTGHHDFTPTHERRLLRLDVPQGATMDWVAGLIESMLDLIDNGLLDHSDRMIAMQIPTPAN